MGLTAAEAAEILGVTRQSVYRLVHEGKLPKPDKYKNAGLRLDDVERASLERLRPRASHPYWVCVREAAELLGLSRTRIRQLADAGRVPGVLHDGRWWFRRPQIEVVANAREARRWADA